MDREDKGDELEGCLHVDNMPVAGAAPLYGEAAVHVWNSSQRGALEMTDITIEDSASSQCPVRMEAP